MKITFLGDSVRSQYVPRVKELLGDGVEIFTPEENCRFAKYTLRGLFDWEGQMRGSRIVHWNNGLWDVCDLFGDGLFSSEEEYVSGMLRIADILLSRYETVIFATTTPVREENAYNKNEDICRFNARLVPLLRERGVIINDLHALMAKDIRGNISDDLIHLTDVGIETCAQAVANTVRACMAELPTDGAVQDTPMQKAGAPVRLQKEQ